MSARPQGLRQRPGSSAGRADGEGLGGRAAARGRSARQPDLP
ncbi:hypothetical protein SSAG_00381 [Streptomyces sp. Mg1]|nr:hypothetical protein SSAG_00381 [Streptomyces sp. Mg1]